eukprot:328937-Amphidinium_carterae.2
MLYWQSSNHNQTSKYKLNSPGEDIACAWEDDSKLRSPSKLGDEISVGAASFVRVDDNSRLQ